MLRKVGVFVVAAALGAGAAAGVAACGEDRKGEVRFEDGGTGTDGSETSGTAGTETTGTAGTESDGETTAPETETSP
jgi:hypothetical protein